MTDSKASPGAAGQDWQRGWPVVLAGACGYMLFLVGGIPVLLLSALLLLSFGRYPNFTERA